jgi:hypothetical protein
MDILIFNVYRTIETLTIHSRLEGLANKRNSPEYGT